MRLGDADRGKSSPVRPEPVQTANPARLAYPPGQQGRASRRTPKRGNLQRRESSGIVRTGRELSRSPVLSYEMAGRMLEEQETHPKMPPWALIILRPIVWNSGK